MTGTVISSTAFNALTADLATGLTTALTKDGQTTPTANIPLGGFKITGLANGSAATDAAAFGQISAFGAPGYTTTATAAGTTTLTVASTQQQYFTGTTTQTVTLPVTTTLVLGFQFEITNDSTGVVTVNSSGGNAVVAMVSLSRVTVTCILASGTTAASWNIEYTGKTTVTGTGNMVLATSPAFTTPNIGAATGTTLGLSGDLTMTAASIFQAEGAAVASAAETDIWAASDGDTIHITGTTTITSLGTAPQAGCWKQLIFDDALILTQAANLNLNAGGANITTVTDDVAFVYADTTTQMDVTFFPKNPTLILQNSQSAAYTTVLGDAGKHILHPTTDNNARTFTIDSNANVAYVIGTAITFVNMMNTVTIAITSDTMTLAGGVLTGSRTLAVNGIATALKLTSTTWLISGSGIT